MTPDEYQRLSARTLLNHPEVPLNNQETMILWCAMGLAGETGETIDDIKKAVFHRHGLDKKKLIKELGDILWYVAGLCTTLQFSLDEVMEVNVEKLKKRYPNGFNSEDSKFRKE